MSVQYFLHIELPMSVLPARPEWGAKPASAGLRSRRAPKGDRCATNQASYSLSDRGIERDLLPWCERRGMPTMAYSPLGGAGTKLLRDPALARIGAAHGCSPAAVALAWTIRSGNVIAIPESWSVAHVKENAVALSLTLRPQDLQALDAAHPPRSR
jgi:diketogulonate reductase-like aldo/keto reductase